MNKPTRISVAILIISFCLLIGSCEKRQVPVLTTSEISNITGTTATSGGTITDEGSGTVISRGVCWSTGSTPTIADNKTSEGAGAGTFTSNLADLNGATKYFARAYATNSVGTGYGMAMSFTTLGELPSAITQAATNVTTSSTILNGIINANHLSTIVTFEYGVSTTYGLTTTSTPSPVSGNSNTSVTAEITGLTPGTIYHFRVKTVNSLGTTYGNDMTFVTLGGISTASTSGAINVLQTSATLRGIVNSNYLPTTVTFEFGETTSYGSSVAATPSEVTGTNSTGVSANITGLTAISTYHYRVKAINNLGTTYSNDDTFTTTAFTLGQTFGGGLICYIDNTGKHGIIAATSDQSTGTTWYNGTFIVTNASGATIGTGKSNTSAIIITQGAGNYAAKICDDLVLNGFDDWYLPSKDELNTMYENLKLHGIGGFADLHYWSSTENSIYGAWDQYFVNGAAVGNDKSYNAGLVRAIRSF